MDERVEAIRKRLAEDAAAQSGVANAWWWDKHVAQRKDAAYLLERLDEAVRLIERLRSMEIVEQIDRIDAFLAHKGESHG
jgi:hypothetical protein